MVKKTIIPATKKLGKELIKEAIPEPNLRRVFVGSNL